MVTTSNMCRDRPDLEIVPDAGLDGIGQSTHLAPTGSGRRWGVHPIAERGNRWNERPMRPAGPPPHTRDVNEPDVTRSRVRRATELIELGRDREAALLADASTGPVGDDRSRTRGGLMDVLSQLDDLGPVLGGVVGEISPDELDNPTPCANFTVRGVLEHMISGATAFTAAFRDVEPSTPDPTDVLAGFGPALSGLVEAIHQPGALERTVQAPFGDVPGATFARFVVLDGLVHGWDLATATAQAYEPPDALVADVESFAREALAPMRDGDTFAAAVEPPESATPIERLAAFTGRDVS
jgi:uncharacterized protein (TIGR03086 family)